MKPFNERDIGDVNLEKTKNSNSPFKTTEGRNIGSQKRPVRHIPSLTDRGRMARHRTYTERFPDNLAQVLQQEHEISGHIFFAFTSERPKL